MTDTLSVAVEMDSPVGPRVVVHGLAARCDQNEADLDTAEIEAEVPGGWVVGWGDEVRTSTGGVAYPLVRDPYAEDEDEEGEDTAEEAARA